MFRSNRIKTALSDHDDVDRSLHAVCKFREAESDENGTNHPNIAGDTLFVRWSSEHERDRR